jgi:hypothetical protein
MSGRNPEPLGPEVRKAFRDRQVEAQGLPPDLFTCRWIVSPGNIAPFIRSSQQPCDNLTEFSIRGKPVGVEFDFIKFLIGYKAGTSTMQTLAKHNNFQTRMLEVIKHDPEKPQAFYFVQDRTEGGELVRVHYESGHELRMMGLHMIGCALLKCKAHRCSWEINVLG